MAHQNKLEEKAEFRPLSDISEEDEDESIFITQNTFTNPISDGSDDQEIPENDLFSPAFFEDIPGLQHLASRPNAGSTQIRGFIMDMSTDSNTTIPPKNSPSTSGLSGNMSNFQIKSDFMEDLSSGDDEEFLINAVSSNPKSYRIRRSVGKIEETRKTVDPDTVDFVQIPPDLREMVPKKDSDVHPLQIFPNITALPTGEKPKKMVSVIKDKIPEATVSTENDESQLIQKCPSTRFHKADDKEISSLQHKSKAERTHIQTTWGVKILRDWLRSEGLCVNFEESDTKELGDVLTKFFACVRQVNGKKYCRSSLTCIRASIHRYLNDPPLSKNININTDGHFSSANSVLKGVIKEQKKEGEDKSLKHPPISKNDLDLMYSSGTLSDENPRSLLFKTFFEVSLHFGRRGREGLKELKKHHIIFKEDENGVEFATLSFHPQEKNHQGLHFHEEEHSQRMSATGGKGCPVSSLKKYLEKLHPECDSFFQRPRSKNYSKCQIWYCNSPLGLNAIGNLMSDISFESELSHRYTNHSIRATCITLLRGKKVHPNDIISVTGHRNIASIQSYSRTTDDTRMEMSHKLSSAIGIKISEKRNPNIEGKKGKSPEKSAKLSPSETETFRETPKIKSTVKKIETTRFEQDTMKAKKRSISLLKVKTSTSTQHHECPVQHVIPTPRKKDKSPLQKSEEKIEFDTETLASPFPSDEMSKSPTEVLAIPLPSINKSVRKLDFEEHALSKNKMNPTEKSREGNTIIIEKGNIIHIHYH